MMIMLKKIEMIQKHQCIITTNYLGIPLTGVNTVKYMGSKYTPQRRSEDGSIVQGDTSGPDILSDTKISTSDTFLNKSKSSGSDKFSERFFKTEINGASIYYNREKNGGPVYFDVSNLSRSESTIKRKSSDGISRNENSSENFDHITFYVENQEDLTKLQNFCLYNISNFISAENVPLKDKEKALRDFGSLFDFTAAKDGRLDSLPGKSTRKILTEEEMSDFHKRVKDGLKKHVVSERKGNGPALTPIQPETKKPLPKDFLPKASRE